jgi:hypothetical protein
MTLPVDMKRVWKPLLLRFVPVLVVFVGPWDWLAHEFPSWFCDLGNALADFDWLGSSRIRLLGLQYPEHPWWVLLNVKNVFTGASFAMTIDTKTVVYIRLVVFFALALAWPIWITRRGLKAFAVALGALIGSIALTLLLPLLQTLAGLKLIQLGAFTRLLISAGLSSLVTYPGMAFAVPGLIFAMAARWASTARPANEARAGALASL